jgi:hypothetical protein
MVIKAALLLGKYVRDEVVLREERYSCIRVVAAIR